MSILSRLFGRSVSSSISFTSDSVSLVSLHKKRGLVSVRTMLDSVLPDGLIVDGVISDEGALLSILRSLRKQSGIRKVHVALPDDCVFRFYADVSLNYDSSPQDLIELELESIIKRELPNLGEDVFVEYDIVHIHKHTAYVYARVMSRSLVYSYVQLLRRAGFSVDVLLPYYDAVLLHPLFSRSGQVTPFVDFGHRFVSVVLFGKGRVFEKKRLPLSRTDVVSVIQSYLDVSYEEAERILETYGFYGHHRDPHLLEQLHVVVEPVWLVLATLVDSWEQQSYRRVYNQASVGSFVLSGSFDQYPGIDYFLGSLAGESPIPFDVWEGILHRDYMVPSCSPAQARLFAASLSLAYSELS